MKKELVLRISVACFCFVALTAFVLTGKDKYEGNALAEFIGAKPESAEIKGLTEHYKMEMVNNLRYTSKEGVELVFKGEALDEIHLYQNNFAFGSYKNALPKILTFGLTIPQVKELLGKPAVDYNSGYCEYQYPNYILSCWFEKNSLNQVVIGAKAK